MGSNWQPSIEFVLLVLTQLGWATAFVCWRISLRHQNKQRIQVSAKREATFQQSLTESEELSWTLTKNLKSFKRQLKSEIQNRVQAESDREKLTRKLYTALRHAELSEGANNALFNLANIVNSIGVVAETIGEKNKKQRLDRLEEAVQLINRSPAELSKFLENDRRGTRLTQYFEQALQQLQEYQADCDQNIQKLRIQVNAAVETIARQQSSARTAGANKEFSIATVCDEAIEINQARLTENGIEIHCDIQPVPPIRADKLQVVQILVNLISNAAQSLATADTDQPQIKISACLDEAGRLNISVQDNGGGVTEEIRSQIFQRGFTTQSGSDGLGLHASQCAAQEIGGTLELLNRDENVGAHFVLSIPVATDDDQQNKGQLAAKKLLPGLTTGIENCVTMPFVEV